MTAKLDTSEKQCSKCLVVKPATLEFFRHKKGGLFGLHSWCRECERAHVTAYKAKNSHELRARARLKRASAIEEYRCRERARAAKRRAENWPLVYATNKRWRQRALLLPENRLTHSVRVLVNKCLKGKGKFKRRTFERLGYSADDLRRHLERQFAPGMTWKNYGDWHVDHIVPISSFSFSNDEDVEFKACWALSNLRPLWAVDNKRKNNKRTHLI